MTILDAAKTVGVEIPTLCHHPDLKVAGVCRMCVVDIEGQRTLQAACVFPITNTVKINTHTRKVRKARRHVLQLLLSEHYGECYSCVRNGNCELQSLAEEYGIDDFVFGHPTEPLFDEDHSSYSVMRDMNKCINCRRCVRTCIDLQEVGVLEADRPQRRDDHRHVRGHAARRGGLHQLRPVREPLPHRRPVRQGRDRRRVGRHRRPREARRHPDGPRAALGHG